MHQTLNLTRAFFYMMATCCLCISSTQAKLEDHFKKAQGKSEIHRMRNIDFIYMINLEQRPERLEKCNRRLYPYGIYPYRFSAVNGWELSLKTINDVGVKLAPGMHCGVLGASFLSQDKFEPYKEEMRNYGQTYFIDYMARGTIGIYLSHLSVLQDAYDTGYETIWVMEDDIEIIQNPHLISDLIERLDARIGKGNWDILFTDRDYRNADGNYVPCVGYDSRRPNYQTRDISQIYVNTQIDEDFRRIGARFGAHSMIIRRSGMEKILNFAKTYQIFFPYDVDFAFPDGIRLFTVLNDVVANEPKSTSDNRTPTYN